MESKVWRAVALPALLLGSGVLLEPALASQLRLPAVFSEGMVLQRETDAPVWGRAAAGQRVTVRGSWMDAPVETTAGADGAWRLSVRTPPAGGPYELVVRGREEIVLRDVQVGEVWFASGQSNMQWPLQRSDGARADIGAADYPLVRIFDVRNPPSMVPAEDCHGEWRSCRPWKVGKFSAVAYHFALILRHELGVPIGVVTSSWSGTPASAWTSARGLRARGDFDDALARIDAALDSPPDEDLLEEQEQAWWRRLEAIEGTGAASAPRARHWFDEGYPSSLFNGMVAPIVPYAVRGVLWYQGEADVGLSETYRTLFPDLIRDWREHWGRGDFPFLFVQIAPFAYPDDTGQAARLREAQAQALACPNTGMAVTMDIGDPGDIHPRNKREVGRRLALWALARTYGRRDLVYSGPLYRSMQVSPGRLRIEFEHAAGLSFGGAPPTCLAIAGEDRVFHPASATIEGDALVVTSPAVPAPVAVRYAFGAADVPNLVNGAGLPAPSFRTDDWD